jgi:translation initiation factor IF-2
MSTPGNRELYEMVQALEQKITELQGKLHMVENDLDDMDGRTNKLVSNIVIKADWNEGIHILKRIGALNDVDIRRGLI